MLRTRAAPWRPGVWEARASQREGGEVGWGVCGPHSSEEAPRRAGRGWGAPKGSLHQCLRPCVVSRMRRNSAALSNAPPVLRLHKAGKRGNNNCLHTNKCQPVWLNTQLFRLCPEPQDKPPTLLRYRCCTFLAPVTGFKHRSP